MEKIYYDVIYLTACGVNSVRPSEAFLMELKRRGEENRAADTQAGQQVSYLEQLYRVSRAHSLDALVGSTLRQAGNNNSLQNRSCSLGAEYSLSGYPNSCCFSCPPLPLPH